MRILGVILVVLVLASVAFAWDATCKACGVKFPNENAVRWGMMSFCGESCKDEYAEKDNDLGTCEGCGVEVKGARREYVSGNTRYIKIGERPSWDGYCTACRADKKTGKEIGTGRRGLEAAAEDAEWDDEEKPAPAPKAKRERETDKEAEGGFGALTYVLVIAGVMVGLIRFFLK